MTIYGRKAISGKPHRYDLLLSGKDGWLKEAHFHLPNNHQKLQ